MIVRSRRFCLLVLIVVGILVLLVGVAIGLIHTTTAKRLVFAQIQKIVNKQGVALDAVDFDYNFWTLRISSAKVSVRSASAPELPSVFTADYVMAQIDLFELLEGRYRVKEAIITNPKVQIVVDEQGRSNIPSSNTSTGEPIDWLILKLRSAGGSLSFEDRSQNVFVNLPEWNLSIDGTQITGTQDIQFQTHQVAEVRYGGKTLNVQTIDARLALKDRNETLEVERVSISTDIADLAISGTVKNLNDPSLDVAATSKIHLEPASRHLSIKQKLEGDLNVEASLKGRPSELKVTGRIKGENLIAEPIDRIFVDVDVACDVAAQRAQLNSFLARSPNLSVSGTADLALAANAGESRIDARLDAADLERISKILKLPVAVASRATGDAHVRWAGLDFNNGFDGSARLQFAAQPGNTSLRRIPLMGAVTVRADNNKAVASIDSLAAGALYLRGQLSLTPSKHLSGSVRLEASDAGDALRQAANWFGTTPVGLEILGAAGVDAKLAGTLDHPRILATLQANDLRINQLKDIDLEALAEYTPEQLDLQKLTLKWEEESLIASGRMDLTKPSPTLDAHAEVANASIERILASLNQAKVPVAGNVGLAAQFSGTVANPAAHLTISASDLQAYGEPLGTLSAEAHMAKQVVQLDNLSLDKLDDGQLQASGRYEMTTRTYAVRAKTSELKVRRLLLTDGTAVTANLSLNADGSGTFENPGGVLRLSARDLQVGSESLGSIDIDANATDHRALITANAPAYAVTANATIGTVYPYPAEIEVRASDTDISLLRQAKDLSGRVSAIVNASANLSDINNARVHTEVPSFRINWLNRTITNDGPIDLEYAGREIKISRAAVRVEDSSVRISGNLPLDAEATGGTKKERRTNLVTLSELIPSETPVTARGELNLIGSLRGNLKRINPDARIT